MSINVSPCFNLDCCDLQNIDNVIKALWFVCVCGFEGEKGKGEIPTGA